MVTTGRMSNGCLQVLQGHAAISGRVQGRREARGAAGSGNDVLHIQKEWNSQLASSTVVGGGKTQKGLAGISI